MSERLVMWTIYDHPRDHPDLFVARAYLIGEGPEPVPSNEGIAHRELEPLRQQMRDWGLTCLPRNEGDDPMIVETWL